MKNEKQEGFIITMFVFKVEKKTVLFRKNFFILVKLYFFITQTK